MTERIIESINNFSDYYQKTLLRRLIVGLVVGSFLWSTIFVISNMFYFLQNDGIWWRTLLHDLPLVGVIMALIISLQIWGLLPQPTNYKDKQVSTKNQKVIRNKDQNNERQYSGEMQQEDSVE